jgi:hypothetical protein
MPMERRPANPFAKGPRPGSRGQPHRVQDNETLETVAQKYGVSARQLMLHNFGTTDPAEVNWYLRENVGCKLPTRDQLNWRFSSAANPGLIYIPQQQLMRMDPLEVAVNLPATPVNLSLPGPPEFLASQKFTHEFKIPPKDPANLGYFIAQARIIVEGEMKQQGGVLKTSLRKDQVKLAVEKKLTEDTKATFGVKFEEKSLKPIAEAVAKGSKEHFFKALAGPFEASIKTTYRWGKLSVVPEAGLEFSTTPLVIRVAGEYEDSLILEGAPFKGKFVVKAGFNVGLSAKGWAWVGDKVGRPILRQFLAQGGRALVVVGEWLVAEGVLAAGAVVVGTIVGTLAITSLCAWAVQDAKRKGELIGLATWYVSAYTAKVFREPRPSGFIIGDTNLRDQLIVLGEKDALLDARAVLSKAGHAASQGSDQEALDAFCRMLWAENKGNDYNAKLQLKLALEEKSKKLAGL